jgi:hypothetical protein
VTTVCPPKGVSIPGAYYPKRLNDRGAYAVKTIKEGRVSEEKDPSCLPKWLRGMVNSRGGVDAHPPYRSAGEGNGQATTLVGWQV